MQYKIIGKVIKGDGYGRKLGFPTINLDVGDFLHAGNMPLEGVYSGEVFVKGAKYKAGIVISAPNGEAKVEAHLIDFDGDLYGEMAELSLGKFLREYKKFETEEELIKQIEKDILQCK